VAEKHGIGSGRQCEKEKFIDENADAETQEQMVYYRGKRYELDKKAVGEHKGNQYTKEMEIGQNVPIPKNQSTAQRLGDEYGVGENTFGVVNNDDYDKYEGENSITILLIYFC
jgi:hypothetical protein